MVDQIVVHLMMFLYSMSALYILLADYYHAFQYSQSTKILVI